MCRRLGTSCSQREVLDKKVLPNNLSLHFTTNHMSMRQKALLLSRHERLWNITHVSFRIKLVFGKAPHPHRHHPRRFPKGVAHALSWPTRPCCFRSACNRNSKARGTKNMTRHIYVCILVSLYTIYNYTLYKYIYIYIYHTCTYYIILYQDKNERYKHI